MSCWFRIEIFFSFGWDSCNRTIYSLSLIDCCFCKKFSGIDAVLNSNIFSSNIWWLSFYSYQQPAFKGHLFKTKERYRVVRVHTKTQKSKIYSSFYGRNEIWRSTYESFSLLHNNINIKSCYFETI